MPSSSAKPPKAKAPALGAKAFAAISAVEGLLLSASSTRRLNTLKASGLTADERRAEVLRAYTGLGTKK
jgi:hypothetical protein